MKKYFGTDGVRGLSNTHPMTADFALKLGMSAAIVLGKVSNKTNRVIIGKDTRLSCYMLETVLTAGLTSMGKDVLLLGPMPTPAVAMLTRSMRADLGIMISASHNPYYDNGIKLFDKFGYKLSDEDELKIEDLIDKNNYRLTLDSQLITWIWVAGVRETSGVGLTILAVPADRVAVLLLTCPIGPVPPCFNATWLATPTFNITVYIRRLIKINAICKSIFKTLF